MSTETRIWTRNLFIISSVLQHWHNNSLSITNTNTYKKKRRTAPLVGWRREDRRQLFAKCRIFNAFFFLIAGATGVFAVDVVVVAVVVFGYSLFSAIRNTIFIHMPFIWISVAQNVYANKMCRFSSFAYTSKLSRNLCNKHIPTFSVQSTKLEPKQHR